MNLKLTVHSYSPEPIMQEVTLANGAKVFAAVPGVVVELVDPLDERNNQTFRFVPEDWADTADLFTVGGDVLLTVTKGE